MKPFLAVDKTENEENKYPNGVDFHIADISKETYEEYMSVDKEKQALEGKFRIPVVLQYLQYFLLLLAICAVMNIAPFFFKPTNINENNAPSILITFLLFIVGLCGYFLLKKHFKSRNKNFFESEEYKSLVVRSKELNQKIRKEFEIPDNAIQADILFFRYKSENGIISPVSNNRKEPLYTNPLYFFYVKNDILYVSTAFDMFAVPLDSFKRIRKVNEYIKLPFWNKPVSIYDKQYAPYHITKDNKELFIDSYYILEFIHNDVLWGLYFPCYELPIFERLTGLKAQ